MKLLLNRNCALQLGDEPASMAEAEQRRRQACRDGDERTAARAGALAYNRCLARNALVNFDMVYLTAYALPYAVDPSSGGRPGSSMPTSKAWFCRAPGS